MQPGTENIGTSESNVTQPLVLVVDDDAALREALCDLLLSAGHEPAPFSSTAELLASDLLDHPGCLVLDVRMPGASGLDLQQQLGASGIAKPIIFLTGHGDIPMTVQAMKAGAVDFLTKPVRDQTLLDAVSKAIAADVKQRASADAIRQVVERVETLTPREWEVMSHVAKGRLNKQIAYDLGISQVTVKLHRGNMMRKMQAVSVGELIRAWEIMPKWVRARIDGTAMQPEVSDKNLQEGPRVTHLKCKVPTKALRSVMQVAFEHAPSTYQTVLDLAPFVAVPALILSAHMKYGAK